jgi:hypothetical protein
MAKLAAKLEALLRALLVAKLTAKLTPFHRRVLRAGCHGFGSESFHYCLLRDLRENRKPSQRGNKDPG